MAEGPPPPKRKKISQDAKRFVALQMLMRALEKKTVDTPQDWNAAKRQARKELKTMSEEALLGVYLDVQTTSVDEPEVSCSICLEPLMGEAIATECLIHVQHAACLAQWKEHSNTCPDCRAPL